MNYEQQELELETITGLHISAIDMFMNAASQPHTDTDTVKLYHEVITREEVKEYKDDYVLFAHYLDRYNNYGEPVPLHFINKYVDGCIDTIWCILCELRGLGLDPVALFNEVARSNLSKIADSGSIEKNAAGKVMKPVGYSAPDLNPILKQSALVKQLITVSGQPDNTISEERAVRFVRC
jgi:hypothetical protein